VFFARSGWTLGEGNILPLVTSSEVSVVLLSLQANIEIVAKSEVAIALFLDHSSQFKGKVKVDFTPTTGYERPEG
jgi:hypothetical protein